MTVDVEDGYPDEPGGIEATIDAVVGSGAVGVNIEDSHARPSGDRRGACGRAAQGDGQGGRLHRVRLFVNARIDTFLFGGGSGSTPLTLLADAVERAHAYVAAGVHGIFVPGSVGSRPHRKHWRPRIPVAAQHHGRVPARPQSPTWRRSAYAASARVHSLAHVRLRRGPVAWALSMRGGQVRRSCRLVRPRPTSHTDRAFSATRKAG